MTTTTSLFNRLAASAVMLIALGVAAPAQAYFATFDDRDTFTNTASDLTNIDFEGYAAQEQYRSYGSYGLTVDDVHFAGSNNYLYIVDDAYYPIYYDWGSDAILFGYKGGTITATFAAGVHAVGSDFMALAESCGNLAKAAAGFTVTLSDGSQYQVMSDDYPDRAFFGVVSDEFSITSIAFNAASNAYVQMDNFIYGNYTAASTGGGSSDVPVPGGIVLMIPGLLWLLRRRTDRTDVTQEA